MKQNKVFEYLYERICQWRLKKAQQNPAFKATYPRSGTMYVLSTDKDGMMDTQMSQESVAFEHEHRGILIASRLQPFTTMEKGWKEAEKQQQQMPKIPDAESNSSEEIKLSQSSAENDHILKHEVSSDEDNCHTSDDDQQSHPTIESQANVKDTSRLEIGKHTYHLPKYVMKTRHHTLIISK